MARIYLNGGIKYWPSDNFERRPIVQPECILSVYATAGKTQKNQPDPWSGSARPDFLYDLEISGAN